MYYEVQINAFYRIIQASVGKIGTLRSVGIGLMCRLDHAGDVENRPFPHLSEKGMSLPFLRGKPEYPLGMQTGRPDELSTVG